MTKAIRVLLATAVLTAFALAQSFQGSISGLVLDQGGGTLPGAKVTLTEDGTGVVKSTLTNSTGQYAFGPINPGTFTLSVESKGFKKLERKGVVVGTSQTLALDLRMEVGDLTQTVNVTEEVPLLETGTASQGATIERQKLVDLPNLGRNPYMMSTLAPNVQQVGNPAYNRMQDQSGSSAISLAGGPARSNNYLLDGIPITDTANRAMVIVSIESTEEMKVQAGNYDAETGRTGGGMFNVLMKGGSNQYHGVLYGSMRETEWMGNNFFLNRGGRARVDQPNRTYAGAFGGALKIPKLYDGKNKTFFWLAFEGYRDTQGNGTRFSVPTAEERLGNFSGRNRGIYDPTTTDAAGIRQAFPNNTIPASRLDPVGRRIAQEYALPQETTSAFGSNNYTASARLGSKADQKTAKLDHNFSQNFRMGAYYLRYNSIEPGDTWFPTISSPDQWRLDRRVDATGLSANYTANSTTVISARYGFNRFPNYGFQASQNYDPAQLGFQGRWLSQIASRTFPNITMQALHNFGTNNNFLYVPHSKNFATSVSKFLGRHNLKAGFDFRSINNDGIDFGNASGQYAFNDTFTRRNARTSDGTGADLASMLLGAPSDAQGYIATKLFYNAKYYSFFVHDDFRLNNKLTLNMGVRWERENGFSERNNNFITGFDTTTANPLAAAAGTRAPGVVQFAGVNGKTTIGNPNLNKIAPRIGIAYQLNDKTTIRTGYGLFWGPQTYMFAPYSSEGVTATTQPAVSNDGNFTPALSFTNSFVNGWDTPVGNTLAGRTGIGKALTIYDPNARSMFTHQFSFDVQRQLAGGLMVSVGYVGSRSGNLQIGTANYNINQIPRSAWSESLRATGANPFAGRGGSGVISAANVTQAQLQRPFPTFGNINYQLGDQSWGRYDSMAVQVRKRMSNGLTVQSVWTYSKNFDASSGGAGNNLNGGNVGPQDALDFDSEYGVSYLHSPHRVATSLTYELPFGKGRYFGASANRALDMLIGGWSLNSVSVMQTGYPLQIRQDNLNGFLFTASQRPNATGINPATTGDFARRLDNWINPAAFSVAPAATAGNLSRTISLRGPGQVNWNMSLFKDFKVYESFKAQFRAEALNAMNTPLFRSPDTLFIPGRAQFGQVTTQANFARMIQLGLRLSF
jgi:trimeric autotransporter adhesin